MFERFQAFFHNLTSDHARKGFAPDDPRIAVAVDGSASISFTPELLEDGEEAELLARVSALAGAGVAVG